MSLPATTTDPARVRYNARAKANVRRMRARRAKGIYCALVRLSAGEIERLVAAGYLVVSAGVPVLGPAVEAFLADHL
jgi:hypothetical protein